MRLIVANITTLLCAGAFAAGNPFPAMTDQSIKIIQGQSPSGLGLTGGFTPAPPKFSSAEQNKTVIYSESPRGDAQYNISRQREFKALEDAQYSFGEPVLEGRSGTHTYSAADTSSGGETPTFEVKEVTTGTETETIPGQPVEYGNTFDYKNQWSVGDGWFGANFSYRSKGSSRGDTFSWAGSNATVLGFTTTILAASAQTWRETNNTANTSDDKLGYILNAYLVGQKTEVARSSIPIGGNKEFNEISHTAPKIWQQQYQYFIGPVPVLITGWLEGSATSGKARVEFGAPELNEIYYLGYVKPKATLSGNGKAQVGAFAALPENLRPAGLDLVAKVTLIEGAIRAQANGKSNNKGPCLYVGMEKLRTLKASVYAWAKWTLLDISFVKTFVNAICDNGYFTIPGCNLVQAVVTQVVQLLNFEKRVELLNHPGFDLGNDKPWLNVKGCQANVDPTVVRLCNQSAKDIHASLLIYEPAFSSWKSIGWYRLPAKGCKNVSLGNYGQGIVYTYAEYRGGQMAWAGNETEFCVHKTDPFDIRNAPSAQSCPGDQYKRVKANSFGVPANKLTVHNFGEADLAQFDKSYIKACNKTVYPRLYASYGYFNKTWTARGWFKINQNECHTFDLGEYSGSAYIHANAEWESDILPKWGREANFCVNLTLPDGYTYPYNDTMGCGSNGNERRGFALIPIKQGTTTPYSFRTQDRILPRKVCNNTTESIWAAYAADEQYIDGRRVRATSGWFEIEKDKCRILREQIQDVDKLYVYVMQNGKSFPKQGAAGTTKFCLNPTLKFDETSFPDTCPAGQEKRDFIQMDQALMVNGFE